MGGQSELGTDGFFAVFFLSRMLSTLIESPTLLKYPNSP